MKVSPHRVNPIFLSILADSDPMKGGGGSESKFMSPKNLSEAVGLPESESMNLLIRFWVTNGVG